MKKDERSEMNSSCLVVFFKGMEEKENDKVYIS